MRIETIDDDQAEGAEDFTLRFTKRTTPFDRHVDFERDEITADIRDDDATGGLTVSDTTAGEGDGTLDFTVTLGAAHAQDVTVDYATADGTATTPGDYTATNGTLTILAGATTATISVPIIDDTDEENTETLTLHLTNPTNTTIADKTATGTILNNDRLPRISVADASARENGGKVVFTVTLSPVGTRDVGVDYAVTPYRTDHEILADSATPFDDYIPSIRTLSIPAGAASATVEVEINDDTEVEPNEFFLLRLSNPTNAVLVDDTAKGTIIDNDRRVVRSSSRPRADAPTILPDAPSITFFPSDRELGVGDPPAVLDIAEAFEGTVDSYGAVADNEAVVDVQMSGSELTLTTLAEGVTRISVSASNTRGAALVTFRVQVLDLRAPRTRSFPGQVELKLGDPPTLLDIAAAFEGTIDRYAATQADPPLLDRRKCPLCKECTGHPAHWPLRRLVQ